MTATPDRLEFRFLWNAVEHRRFYKALRRVVWRRGKWALLALPIIVGLFVVLDLRGRHATLVVTAFSIAPYLIIVGGWIVWFIWALPHLSARTYERNHQACIPYDQVRVVSADGIEARCVSTDVKIQWPAISRVFETSEFFLFFTRPNCAIQLPKRAIPNPAELEAVRDLARRHAHVEQGPDVAQ